jgi:predicted house-cleaning noncanonical NTP pyrophosphatase (MazG superfamily)
MSVKMYLVEEECVIKVFKDDRFVCNMYVSPEESNYINQLRADNNKEEINKILRSKAEERLKDELELAAHMSRSLYLNREENN